MESTPVLASVLSKRLPQRSFRKRSGAHDPLPAASCKGPRPGREEQQWR